MAVCEMSTLQSSVSYASLHKEGGSCCAGLTAHIITAQLSTTKVISRANCHNGSPAGTAVHCVLKMIQKTLGNENRTKRTIIRQTYCITSIDVQTIDDHLQIIIRTIVQDRQSTNYGRSKEVQRLTAATEIHQIQRALFLAILIVFAINLQTKLLTSTGTSA